MLAVFFLLPFASLSMRVCSIAIAGRLAEWLRHSTHGRKAWNGTGLITGGGWSVMKANAEGIVSGGMEGKGNSNIFCTITRFAWLPWCFKGSSMFACESYFQRRVHGLVNVATAIILGFCLVCSLHLVIRMLKDWCRLLQGSKLDVTLLLPWNKKKKKWAILIRTLFIAAFQG